ncbi:MAG: peptidylprolyl isomerase, partial [Planctomycetota bacterium]
VLAMAAENPNTAGARFSILQQPTPGGDGKLTVFGRVISGMDVIYRVPSIKPTDIRLGAQPVKIVSMRVLRKQDHPYEPKTLPLSEADKSGK